MKKLIIILLVMTVNMPVVYPENREQKRVFTDQDLTKYGSAPDKTHSAPTKKAAGWGTVGDIHVNTGRKVQNHRYVVPYEGTARRIVVPVTFNHRVTAQMLLDTGATGMHISLDLANRLGILDSDEGQLLIPVSGIGGSVPAVLTLVDSVSVGGAEADFIPTTVSIMKFPGFEGLIGMDFMEKYSMQVNIKERVVLFETLPKSPERPAGHDEIWWRTTFNNFKSRRTAWGGYIDKLSKYGIHSDWERARMNFGEKQYREAEQLYNRLSVYASENSVPLEWR
jgi:hypothetical protein